MSRTATWDVLDYGKVSEASPRPTVDFSCPNCGRTAELPVQGRCLAQVGDTGLVFDVGEWAVPRHIRCRKCRHHFDSTERP